MTALLARWTEKLSGEPHADSPTSKGHKCRSPTITTTTTKVFSIYTPMITIEEELDDLTYYYRNNCLCANPDKAHAMRFIYGT